jgi:pimeloyl-ACP methyl ester carboxylesterase
MLLAMLPTGTQAQLDERLQASPPTIEFGTMRPVPGTDFVERYSLTFPSSFKSGYEENDRVQVHVFLPSNRFGPVPAVVILHYWGATELRLESSLADELATRGIGAVVLELPYHLSRTPDGFRSGELAVSADPDSMKDTMVQSVQDLRRTLSFIKQNPAFRSNETGLVGTSLGAIVGALGFALEPELDSAVFLLGGADLANIVWNSSKTVLRREELRQRGYTEETLREALAPVEPLLYLEGANRPTYVVRATFDTVVPPSATDSLVQALQPEHTLELETGHFGGIFVERRLIRTVVDFFENQYFARGFELPSTIYVPTLRVGAYFNPRDSLQLGVGVDLWRSGPDSAIFAAGVITPRGLQGFVGHQLWEEFSIGVTVLPQEVTYGLMWGVVF